MKKSSLLAAITAAIGLIAMPTNMQAMPDRNGLEPTRGRSRSRIPFGNTFNGGLGNRFNRDTGTRAGIPGSKLVRKAAENRLGLYSGARR